VKKFATLNSNAVAMMMANIDTDIIAPLESLAECAFAAIRYVDGDTDRKELEPDFCLNLAVNQGAEILFTGENFGCGSSRETAAQALVDLGFRCIIGSSFGDIFFENCFQQGLLAIPLPAATVERLAQQVGDGAFNVNLIDEKIITPAEETVPFAVNPWRRECLIDGIDAIDASLRRRQKIDEFERIDRIRRPWVHQARKLN